MGVTGYVAGRSLEKISENFGSLLEPLSISGIKEGIFPHKLMALYY